MDGPRDYHTKWSQRKTNIICYNLYVEYKKMIQMNLFTKQNRLRDFENLCLPKGRGGGRDKLGVWDLHRHTTIYKIDNQQGPAV